MTICDANFIRLREVGEKFGIARRAHDVQEVINTPDIDAVHLILGIPDHVRQAVAVLKAGKHCACTVPMATNLEELQAIITA